jgi:hypothetical protein
MNVRDLLGPVKPLLDRLLARHARRNRSATSVCIRNELNYGGHISVRTVNRRLNEDRLQARRSIEQPQLSLRHWWVR